MALEFAKLSLMSSELSMWCVYEKPRDFPRCFVARRFVITQTAPTRAAALPTSDVVVSRNLDDLREQLALRWPGLVRLARDPNDDPVIVETWI